MESNKGCQLQQSERSEAPQGFVKKEVQRHCEIELIDATVNYTDCLDGEFSSISRLTFWVRGAVRRGLLNPMVRQ